MTLNSTYLLYGTDHFYVNLPSGFNHTLLEGGYDAITDSKVLSHVLTNALSSQPTGSAIEDMAGDSVLVVVPDHTRRWHPYLVLPEILMRLLDRKITILIGPGLHNQALSHEFAEGLRQNIKANFKDSDIPVIVHNPDDESQLADFGRTSYGTPIRLNRLFTESDDIVVIGEVRQHYFAGFSGGPKALLPGCAARETIIANHSLTRKGGLLDVGCSNFEVDNNPVQQDIAEEVDKLNISYAIQVVTDDRGVVVAFVGDYADTVAISRQYIVEKHSVRISQRAPLVIATAGGYPHDANLIQVHKALDNAARACIDGGTIILFAKMQAGAGSDTIEKWLGKRTDDIANELATKYEIHGQTALAIRDKTARINLHIVSEVRNEPLIRLLPATFSVGLKRLADAPIKQALSSLGPDSLVYIIPNADATVPIP